MTTRLAFLTVCCLTACHHSPPVPPAVIPALGARAYPATTTLIRAMGRTDEIGDTVYFGASGVSFFMRFRGRSLAVELIEEDPDTSHHNWFTVVTDGGDPVRIRTSSAQRRYTLASGLPDGEHTLALSKATEGQNGHERLTAIYTDELLQANELPSRSIEFIGNSVTAGFGIDTNPVRCGTGTWYDQTNSWRAYGPELARRVGARWTLTAISGVGLVRNWNSSGPVMGRAWDGLYVEYADTLTYWHDAHYQPGLVVVELGTIDMSDGSGPTARPPVDPAKVARGFFLLSRMLHASYPQARILLTTSPMLDSARNEQLFHYQRQAVADLMESGNFSVSLFQYKHRYTAGCSGHPSLEQHRQMADELEPVVRRLMGWDPGS